jgi:maltose phosphorylase
MAIVEGFGGKRMRDGKLFLHPLIHTNWRKYAFRLLVRDHPVEVTVTKESVAVLYKGPEPIVINVYGKDHMAIPGKLLWIGGSKHHRTSVVATGVSGK